MEQLFKDGFWEDKMAPVYILVLKGKQISYKIMAALDFPNVQGLVDFKIEIGDFGPARAEVKDASGISNYNVKLVSVMHSNFAVVNQSGDMMWFWGSTDSQVHIITKLSQEQVHKKRLERDHIETPSCPHITPKPGTPGKIYWLSGVPGAGKSTTCQLMAREKGYRYFEADSILGLVNPFIDVNVPNPSMAQGKAKPLKGFSHDDAKEIFKYMDEVARPFMSGQASAFDFDSKLTPILKIMAREVSRQKNRLGGDFAVAFAVISRKSRDLLRILLGPDLVFIVLNLTKECQTKRIEARHPGEGQKGVRKSLMKIYDKYEPAGKDEPNSFNVEIKEKMTPKDVMKAVLEVI